MPTDRGPRTTEQEQRHGRGPRNSRTERIFCPTFAPQVCATYPITFLLHANMRARSLGFIFYHLAPYTVSPTDLVVRCSTWEGEGHKTKTHAYVTRTVCVDHIRKNTVTRKIVQLA